MFGAVRLGNPLLTDLESGVEPLSEPVHGPVGRLVGDYDLVQMPDGGAADGAPVADLAVDGTESRDVVLQEGQQVLRVLAGTERRDRRGSEAVLDENLGLGTVVGRQAAKTLQGWSIAAARVLRVGQVAQVMQAYPFPNRQ